MGQEVTLHIEMLAEGQDLLNTTPIVWIKQGWVQPPGWMQAHLAPCYSTSSNPAVTPILAPDFPNNKFTSDNRATVTFLQFTIAQKDSQSGRRLFLALNIMDLQIKEHIATGETICQLLKPYLIRNLIPLH